LNEDQLAAFFGDSTTLLPDGMVRPAHWQQYETDLEFYRAWRAAKKEAGLP